MADFKHIVRIANTDLDGNKLIHIALTKVKGVGRMYSNMVCNLAGVDKNMKAGDLSPDEVKKIDEAIMLPENHNVPNWMMNRRNDPFDGITKHLVAGDLRFAKENDLRELMKMKAYRGFRHQAGLPCRGQRTKSNFRRNKGKAVGVRKRKGAKSGRV